MFVGNPFDVLVNYADTANPYRNADLRPDVWDVFRGGRIGGLAARPEQNRITTIGLCFGCRWLAIRICYLRDFTEAYVGDIGFQYHHERYSANTIELS